MTGETSGAAAGALSGTAPPPPDPGTPQVAAGPSIDNDPSGTTTASTRGTSGVPDDVISGITTDTSGISGSSSGDARVGPTSVGVEPEEPADDRPTAAGASSHVQEISQQNIKNRLNEVITEIEREVEQELDMEERQEVTHAEQTTHAEVQVRQAKWREVAGGEGVLVCEGGRVIGRVVCMYRDVVLMSHVVAGFGIWKLEIVGTMCMCEIQYVGIWS